MTDLTELVSKDSSLQLSEFLPEMRNEKKKGKEKGKKGYPRVKTFSQTAIAALVGCRKIWCGDWRKDEHQRANERNIANP